jgi:hypothetical protein
MITYFNEDNNNEDVHYEIKSGIKILSKVRMENDILREVEICTPMTFFLI